MNEKQYHLVKVIQKIEVFCDFDAQDVQLLLRVCRFRDLQESEHIYTRGEESDEMMILLRGGLRVVGAAGEELARILPGMPIGEMGMFTGMPRSADIMACESSKALVLRSAELNLLLSRAPQIHLKVLSNVVGILSRRVTDANSLAESQQRMIRDLQKRLAQHEPDLFDDDEHGDADDDDEDDDDEDLTVEEVDDEEDEDEDGDDTDA